MGVAEITSRNDEVRKLVRASSANHQLPRDIGDYARPWQLSLVPMVLGEAEWMMLSAGLAQRVRLLEEVLDDLLGDQRLLREGVLPPELLYANPYYYRVYRDLPSPKVRLSLTATDLARDGSGQWCVTGDRTRAPSGLGFALENRVITGQVLSRMFRDNRVTRLAGFFIEFQKHLNSLSTTGGQNPRVAILTSDDSSYRYLEDAYLSRYLGYTLVQGRDLAVRKNQVYLKTLGGLSKLDILQRNITDYHADPLELKRSSDQGAIGLIGAIRTGQVAVTNCIGSVLAQMPALLPFLSSASKFIHNEDLALPSIPTYWCGDPHHLKHVLSNLDNLLIRDAFHISGRAHVDPSRLSKAEYEQLCDRLKSDPVKYVAQPRATYSTTPVWSGQKLVPWNVTLRSFHLQTKTDIHVLPGGLSRVSPDDQSLGYSPLEGRLGQDCWILSDATIDSVVTLLPTNNDSLEIRRTGAELPSRIAENLFWLGRHVERTETIARMLRLIMERMTSQAYSDEPSVLPRLTASLAAMGQIDADHAIEEFCGVHSNLESVLVESIYGKPQPFGLMACIQNMVDNAIATRDRLSIDAYMIISRIGQNLTKSSGFEPELTLVSKQMTRLITDLLAFAGLTSETLTRTLSWSFLQLGRRIERGCQTAEMLASTLTHPIQRETRLMESVLQAADSLMTYRSRYALQLEPAPLLDLLVTDHTNPRSLAFQCNEIVELLNHISQEADGGIHGSDQETAKFLQELISESDPRHLARANEARCRSQLLKLLETVVHQLPSISDQISSRYLIHSNIETRISN